MTIFAPEVAIPDPEDLAWIVATPEEREAERAEWQALGGDLGFVPAYQVA